MRRIVPAIAFGTVLFAVLFLALPAQALERQTSSFKGTGIQGVVDDGVDCGSPGDTFIGLNVTVGRSADTLHVDFGNCNFQDSETTSIPTSAFTMASDFTSASLFGDNLITVYEFPCCGPPIAHTLDFDLTWNATGPVARSRFSDSYRAPGFTFSERGTCTCAPAELNSSSTVYDDYQ